MTDTAATAALGLSLIYDTSVRLEQSATQTKAVIRQYDPGDSALAHVVDAYAAAVFISTAGNATSPGTYTPSIDAPVEPLDGSVGRVVHIPTPLFERLEQLASLGDDWNSYGAPTPNQEATAFARAVLDVALENAFFPEDIAPSVEGGVLICFRAAERYADIECFNDGAVLAMTSEPPLDPRAWPVRNDRRGIQNAVEEIRAFVEGQQASTSNVA